MNGKVKRANEAIENSHESWPRVRLGDLCQIIRGVSYKKNQASGQPVKGSVPILRATNIQDGDLLLDANLVYVPADLVSEEQLLSVGDIVVATSSGSKHLVGKTAQVKEPWTGSFGAFCAVLRPKVEIDHRYLGYYFGSKEYKDYITKKALGVNINNLRRGDLEEIMVPLAPPDQQKRIVAEIEKQFSRLEEGVNNLKRVKANLKRYKAAVLKAAVEGRLVETEDEIARREGRDYETGEQLLQRILRERRRKWEEAELAKMQAKGKAPKNDKWKQKYKEPAAPDTTNLPELPEGWVWANVGQLALVGTGATPKRSESRYYGGNIPWVTSAVVNSEQVTHPTKYVTKAALNETNISLYPPGTLLVAMYGEGKTRGKCAELAIEATTNQALAALETDKSIRRYLKLFLDYNYEETRKAASGGVQPNLNLSLIRAILIALPPLAEQHRIVDEVDRRLSILRETEAQVEANLQRAERLRQSILAAAFSGRLAMEPMETMQPENKEAV